MIIAQGISGNKEIVLRSGTAGQELIVDGQFLMSDASGYSSVMLIEEGLKMVRPSSGINVLIGGLGLGFSLKTALANPGVNSVIQVELEELIINWHLQGLIPRTAQCLNDPRLKIYQQDLVEFVGNYYGENFDLIALDIDNGPEWLSNQTNKRLYTEKCLRQIKSCLKSNGVVSFWSADPAPKFKQLMRKIFSKVVEKKVFDHNGEGRVIPAFIYFGEN